MKLSPNQRRALGKLTRSWQCGYDIREGLQTLQSLVRKGFAQCDYSKPGAYFFPRTHVSFRLTKAGRKEKL